MGFIVSLLQFPAAAGLLDRIAHGIRHIVRIHDHMTFTVSCGTSDGLDQRCLRPQESFLVRIQDRNQRDFRNIQSFSQQVDSHQHIKHIQTHIADDLRSFQGINIRVKISDTNSHFLHVIRQIFRHSLGQGCHQHFMMILYFLSHFGKQIIDLPFHRTDIHLRIQKTGRTNDLLRSQ